VNVAVHQVQVLLARLSPREQKLVAAFAGLAAVALLWSAVISPFLGGRETMRREIAGLRDELSQLDALARQVRQIQAERPAADKTGKAPADFSLLGFVEKAAGSSLRPESIASMTPSRRPLDGGRQEHSVELKLSSVTLVEAVALLRAVEGQAGPVQVKQFSLKKRYDDSSRFDLTLVTSVTLAG
jgi:hypothetical protein